MSRDFRPMALTPMQDMALWVLFIESCLHFLVEPKVQTGFENLAPEGRRLLLPHRNKFQINATIMSRDS